MMTVFVVEKLFPVYGGKTVSGLWWKIGLVDKSIDGCLEGGGENGGL